MKRILPAFIICFTLLFAACASPNTPLPPVAQEAIATDLPVIPTENMIQLVSVDPPVENGLSASDPITITFSYSLTEEMGTLQVWFDSFLDDQCTSPGAVPTDPKGSSTMPGGLMQPLNGGSQTLSVFIPPIPPIGVQYIGVGVRLWNTEETTNLAEDVDYAYCYEAQTPTVALEPVSLSVGPISSGSTVTDTPDAPAAPPPASGTETGGITGIVYADENSNGRQDSGEAGVSTYGLTLSDNTCMTVLASTSPDAGGGYDFAGLTAGRYCVVLHYSLGTPVVPNVHQVVDVSVGTSANASFGIQPAITTPPPAPPPPPESPIPPGHASISISVYRLTSCDSSERVPVAGNTVNLNQAGTLFASATTASNGSVSFFMLPGGDYVFEIMGLVNCVGRNQWDFHLEGNGSTGGVFEAAP